MSEPLYAERDAQELEPWFSRHLSAMTGEALHSKSDIACELAFRDAAIAELLETIKLAEEMVAEWGAYASDYFQNKWDLSGDLEKLRAVIAKHERKVEA